MSDDMTSAMPCLDANDVVRLLDGGATAADEDHIDACADCRALVTELGRALEVEPAAAPDGADELASWELASGAELVARGAKVGRYVVLDAIGAGAMGVVYRAYDPELDRDVALKLVRVLGDSAGGERARARLVREAQSLAKVAHPNVVAVYDASTYGEHVFVAMELVEGADLEAWLDTPRPWRDIARAFVAAGRGLAAAHAAGVIHRDVKPANILVGNDGRARITDFGLATPSPDAAPDIVAGTPAFMSPEVKAGAPADERSDQYSFAASLLAALSHPGAAPRAPIRPAAPSAPTVTAAVPRALRGPLARALSTSPAARYPDLDALLAAIERALVPTARRVAPYAAALALAGLLGGGAFLATRDAAAPACAAPAERLAGVWDAPRKATLRAAFDASGHPLARDQWARAEASLDAFAAAWSAAYVDTCEATHARHEQSAELLDLRMTCLHGERARLLATTTMFEHADRAIVGRAIGLADLGASRLARCSDAAALRAAAPMPADPVGRARAAAATAMLAAVESISLAGKYPAAMAGARTVIAEAIAVGDVRLEADATRSLGETQWRAGEYAAAHATLQAAIDAAKRAGGADLEAGALLDLVAVLIEDAKYGEALQVTRIAEATVRASHDQLRLANLHGNRAAIHLLQGDYKTARTDYECALAGFEQLFGPDDRRVGQSLMNLALVATELGDTDPLPLYERAIAVLSRALGPRHPEVALARNNRAIALANAKRHPEALRELSAALAIRVAVLGAEHRDTLGTMMTMGAVADDAGDHTAALAHYQTVLAGYAPTLRADHPLLAAAHAGIGRALLGLRRWPDALVALETAVAIYAKSKLATPPHTAARFALARALWETGGDRARARSLARSALADSLAPAAADAHAEITAWLAAHGGAP